MATSATAEKAYYEERYAPFLSLPESDLRFEPAQFLGDLENPSKEVYERSALYQATLKELGLEPTVVASTSNIDGLVEAILS